LVRTAIGFDKDRGDQVQVINLKFAEANIAAIGDGEPESFLDSMMSLSKSDYFTIAELAVIALVSLLVLLMVVRPLVSRIVTPEDVPALTADGDAPQLTGPDGEALALPAPRNHTAEALENARAMGDVQAKAVEEVGETILNNPDEAVTIIRDWIAQKA
jgi:flagellar M-ring protein FliF